MTKKLLAICHSAGDTQPILSAAKILADRDVHTSILVIGQAAKDQITQALKTFTKNQLNISLVDIDKLCEEKPIENKLLSLSDKQLESLTQDLQKSAFDGLLVGTPSYILVDQQSQIPKQILEKLAPHLPSAVFSDYAFYDPLHTLSKDKWFSLADKFLVPFKKAIGVFKADPDKTEVVGHPAIDNMKTKYAHWLKDEKVILDTIHQKMNQIDLDSSQPFVFVAGGKAGDESLIESLAIACQQVPNLKIYIGVHPAAEQTYIEQLQEIIDSNKMRHALKILPKGKIDTDEMVYLSNAVMSISSTVSASSAACSKLAAYFQENKERTDLSVPYILDDFDNARFYNNKAELVTFLKDAAEKSRKIKADSVVVEITAAEKIADAVQTLMKQKI